MRTSRAQTAIEMVFILSIIFIGLILIIPSYTDNSTNMAIVSAVRSSTSKAITYLNTGVMSDEEPYTLLNSVMEEIHNAEGNPHLAIKTLESEESERDANITITISTPFSSVASIANLNETIKDFIEKDLLQSFRFTNSSGTLKYGGKVVRIKVRVERG
ncbi:hypothetical protein OCC_01559 [Thermococcus litoralis DSM 5473]|uniref:Class III signal peptide-containing protein n=1 Tax=Thermococcus litoralis (strain ATCC 51850 / DSM 5473 / JCM 8560 / NS-C) TaxID=523849 RepID=H3ZLN7_THELN|nr:hypothetical protein [Thermococcus litoralis]EHR79175.1 hypothetical protein OCC_01559 [Thermococcus litoralis DSM 5473]